MSMQNEEEFIEAVLRERDSAGAFESLCAYWLSKKIEHGDNLTKQLVKEVFEEAARKLSAPPTPRDDLDIEYFFEALVAQSPQFKGIKGEALYRLIFSQIYRH